MEVLVALISGLIGILIGCTATWALKAGAELKAFKAKELSAIAAEATKLKIAADKDVATVEVVFKNAHALWDKLRADADELVTAKVAAAAAKPTPIPPVVPPTAPGASTTA